MTKLIEDFREIRRVSTPWCVVRTTDYMATIRTLLLIKAPGGGQPPACIWTCVDGIISPIKTNTGETLGEDTTVFSSADDPPFQMLAKARTDLPENGILFMVAPDNTLWENTFTIQAISNLRDEFKGTMRTLVILGIDPKLPPFLVEDVPVLDDPLPSRKELLLLVQGVVNNFTQQVKDSRTPKDMKEVSEEDMDKAAATCLGMTRFAAEEAISRKLKRAGIDLKGLADAQKSIVEQSSRRALVFEKEAWNFDDMGGNDAFKQYMDRIFAGPRKPDLLVRVDEIEKSITAASSGQVADNTGVSQDILKTFLTAMEDNKWMGLLAVGGPGTGKTLASICTGNQYGVRTLAADLGAVKDSYVGNTEQNIRRMVNIIYTMGGQNVLFIATCNRMDTLPPELQRRFWLGTWFWDSPNEAEKKSIWEIQRARFTIDPKYKQPDDTDWTGSDIRNCCQMAWVASCTLLEAEKYITITGRTNRSAIEKLRDTASMNAFRSASRVGPYARPERNGAVTRKVQA